MKWTVKKVKDDYMLIGDDYQEKCTLVHEKKTDTMHVKLPKDNPSGRSYIRQSIVDEKGEATFETKTVFRTGLSGGGWRAKMTDDERAEVEKIEARLAEIKSAAAARQPEKVDPNSVEGLEAQIARLTAKLAATKVK